MGGCVGDEGVAGELEGLFELLFAVHLLCVCVCVCVCVYVKYVRR